MVIGVSRDAADLERALTACAQRLQQAQKQLVQSPIDAFHARFLEVLRGKYDTFVRDMRHLPAVARVDPAPAASAPSSRDRWSKRSLQAFLSMFFAVYETPEPFGSLWTLLLPHRMDAPHQHLDLSKTAPEEEDESIAISFETLKDALKRHATDRLLERDPFPLEPEWFLDASYCKRKAGHEDELELPRLQTAVPKRSSLPTPSRPAAAAAPGRHSTTAAAVSSLSTGAASRKDVSYSGSNSTPLLQDFHAEVMKKSRNWLGRWQTRHLFLRWNELKICKKNVSAHRSGPTSGVPVSPSGGLLSSASANAAKSKRYPLQTLLSLQIVQLNESDPSKKQAISLHFKQPTANGGNTTKLLTLGCDSSDHLKTVVIQIATFALFYGLTTGQDVPSLQKFIKVGANLDVYCAIPSPNVPPFPLSPLQLAFLQSTEWKPASFEATVQLLVHSGADPRSILRWNFATHVLFSSAYGAGGEMFARRLLMVRESIDGVMFPFGGIISDDEYQWNLLMYFCCYGDLDGARQLLTTFSKISRSKCLKYVDHVNTAGDNALHIAIKTSPNHANSEELAMLLVDVGTGNATFITTTASGTTGGEATMTRTSVVSSLSSSSSYVDSQLVHCCDGNGETVFHLALKARLWRLVDKLVDCKATDPTSCDRHGNTSLHLAIKVGAPVHTIARIIQLYRPNRSSAFNSVSSERSQLVTTLGYESCERHGNDTPLTLAIKYRREEVVELLLSAGAAASAGDCLWSLATVPLELLVHDPQLQNHSSIGDADPALHVAIKAGLQHAAAALVAKDANVLLVDSNGASALALAIRYGMYELSVKIAEKVAGADAAAHNREQKQWIDQETGAPVCILAIKAGQIELATLLLDISSNQMSLSHLVTKETLLHILVKNISWLECSGVSGNKTEKGAQETEGANDTSIALGEDVLAKRTRRRVKSRSDGDLRYLWMPGLDANPTPSTPTMESSLTSTSSDADDARISERIDFFQQVEEALILGVLQRSNDCSVVAAATKHQPVHNRSSFHLATSPSVVVTDHNVDSYTPLHVAAAGGDATSNVLGLFLAYLYMKSTPSCLEMAEILAKTTGSHAENPLHAALGSNSSCNGLQLLYALQLARGKQDLLPVQGGSITRAAVSDTLQDKKRINSICSQILEAATVPNGSTPLHLSCRWPQSVDMLHVTDLLLQEDVYAGSWDSDGVTPLHVGVLNNCDKRLIQLFKRHHQDLNLWTEGKGRFRMLRSLSGVGSDSQVRDATEYNSDRRRGSTRTSDTSTLSNGERAGTEPSTPKPALMLAIEYENAVAFHELVRCGAQLRVVTPRSHLGLLHFAAYNKLQNKELLLYLLECNRLVEYDVTDTFGLTTADAVKLLQEQLNTVKDVRLDSSTIPASSTASQVLFVNRKTSIVLEETNDEVAGLTGALQPRSQASSTTSADSSSASRSGSLKQLALQIPERLAELGGSGAELSAVGATTTQLAPLQSISISYSPPPPLKNDHSRGTRAGEVSRFADAHASYALAKVLSSNASEMDNRGQISGAAPRAPDDDGEVKAKSTPGSPSRAPRPGTARFLQNLPKAPGLDNATIEYLREEEKATLTLVAHEARQEAKDWLKKRIGQKKLLSDARAQLQSAQKHRRTGSGSVLYPKTSEDPLESQAALGLSFVQENERLLEQYKALAAKKFIDKHVAEAVAEARMEIERVKQAIFQETGIFPGGTTTKHNTSGATSGRRDGLHRTASTNNSLLLSSSLSRSETNATLLSDETVWWSERGGSSVFGDEGGMSHTWLSAQGRGGTMLSDGWNSTWLSSTRGTVMEYRDPHLSSTFQSFLESEYNDPFGAESIPGVTFVNESAREPGEDDRADDDQSEDEYLNPLDRGSFSHVIETRNSLSNSSTSCISSSVHIKSFDEAPDAGDGVVCFDGVGAGVISPEGEGAGDTDDDDDDGAGALVVGASDSAVDGSLDGVLEEGDGVLDGAGVFGFGDGLGDARVGVGLGVCAGVAVGFEEALMFGVGVGLLVTVGALVGAFVGAVVGADVGAFVGANVGATVGLNVVATGAAIVGAAVGAGVAAARPGSHQLCHQSTIAFATQSAGIIRMDDAAVSGAEPPGRKRVLHGLTAPRPVIGAREGKGCVLGRLGRSHHPRRRERSGDQKHQAARPHPS